MGTSIGQVSPVPFSVVVPPEQLRLIVRVARLYHESGLKQQEIASKLSISQARVSRMLKQAVDMGLVRTVVSVPSQVFPELEERLELRYDLDQVIVVDSDPDSNVLASRLGRATARYVESVISGDDVVGISSWSDSLLRAARELNTGGTISAKQVVQLVGGLGNTEVQMLATEIMQLFSMKLKAEPVFMLTPAILGTKLARETLGEDVSVQRVARVWNDVSIAIYGVGAVAPSPLLARSGNSFREDDRDRLYQAGAVGDVFLRYFDAEGKPIGGDFDDRVMSIPIELLRSVPRRVAVAGGESKFEAIRACLRGGWATTIITDASTAERLADD